MKHLLKPLVNPDFHGRAVADANEVLLGLVRAEQFPAELANVKIIGPLNTNIALVNLRPVPPPDFAGRICETLAALPVIHEVRLVDGPLTLVVKASPAIAHDPNARYWVQHGRLQPDFAFPIDIDWRESANSRLHTFHVVASHPSLVV